MCAVSDERGVVSHDEGGDGDDADEPTPLLLDVRVTRGCCCCCLSSFSPSSLVCRGGRDTQALPLAASLLPAAVMSDFVVLLPIPAAAESQGDGTDDEEMLLAASGLRGERVLLCTASWVLSRLSKQSFACLTLVGSASS